MTTAAVSPLHSPAMTRVIDALEQRGSARSGRDWQCPAHEDRTPSLSVTPSADRVLLHCHKGCPTDAVVEALGLKVVDLFDAHRAAMPVEAGVRHAPAAPAPMREVARYVYEDGAGEPISTKTRLEPVPNPERTKRFTWDQGNPHVLYRLPEVVEAEHVWLHEGEKAADRMAAMLPPGHAATCAPTTKWEPEFNASLLAKTVTVVADRDDAGLKQARAAFESLKASDILVRLVHPAVESQKADAFDHLEAGYGLEDFVALPASALDAISFSGSRLVALLDEPAPDPVYPLTPPSGHFSLLVSPSFVGKTSAVLWVGMARVCGVEPWLGAPVRPPGRVLFYSLDEPPSQVARRIQALSRRHPGGSRFVDYANGFVITGPHRSVNSSALDELRFTEEGLDRLESFILQAAQAGQPFTDIIVDAYSDLLPLGETDQSNEEATRIGGRLERIAVTHCVAILVIHHAGKPRANGEVPDPRDMGRGASALAAKARCIFTLEEEAGIPNVRRVRTRTNLTIGPPPLLLEVSPEAKSDSTRVDYFRPHDPATAYPIDKYLTREDGWISSTELARRLANGALAEGEKPSGAQSRMAAQVRAIWHGAGLIDVRNGDRNSTEVCRR